MFAYTSGHWALGVLIWAVLIAVVLAFVHVATEGDDDESTHPRRDT